MTTNDKAIEKTAEDASPLGIPDRAASDRDLVPEANARATDGDFPGHVEHAFRTIGARLRQHADVINRLQDDEAITRNMVMHCENLIAESEERLRSQLMGPGPRDMSPTQAPGTAIATDVTTQAVAEYGTATPPAEASAL